MKNYLIISILINFYTYSQCKVEVIKTKDTYYEGCVNFEGNPDGKGFLKGTKNGDTFKLTGNFKNGNFNDGEYIVNFKNGDEKQVIYLNYENKIKISEIDKLKNGDEKASFYESGIKIKEIITYGPGDQAGLVIERKFIGNEIIETNNISNNRNPEDIVGKNDYIDVNLIVEENKFKIPIDFIKKDGESFTVPIHFDTGASDFFIGHKLYLELLAKCEVIDLNVKSKAQGVGSIFETKYILIKEIKIDDFIIKNVIAKVPINKDRNGNYINDMLLGIGFLKKFKDVTWSLNNNIIRFYK